MKLQIKVEDEQKAQSLLMILKELDFVEVQRTDKKSSPNTPISRKKLNTKELTQMPFFGICPDWNSDAKDLRKSGWQKRVAGW